MKSLLVPMLFIALFAASSPIEAHAEEFFIRFDDQVSQEAKDQWLADRGIRIVKTFRLIDAVLCESIDKSTPQLRTMSADPIIRYATPNYEYELYAVPDDPQFTRQWSLDNTGQTGGTPGADIAAVEAWDQIASLPEIVVGIIDTGVDYTHPDLAAVMWTNPGEIPDNGIDDDANGYIDDVHGWDTSNNDNDPMPVNYHGTHVAGIVAADINNGLGIAGVSPNARIMALNAYNEYIEKLRSDDVVDAMEYCLENGAHVINASYGFVSATEDLPQLEALQRLNEAGVVFVAAAGNDQTHLTQESLYLTYPACYDVPNIISVAATDHNDELPGFTNTGYDFVDLAAPGVGVLSTQPGSSYGISSGTSFAAPHVTGAVAILKALLPSLTPAEIRVSIMEATTPLASLSRVVESGGRLDLSRVVALADTVAPDPLNDLAVSSPRPTSLGVNWTATGDDGATGSAYRYDLRYSLTPILTTADFESATTVHVANVPREAGESEFYRMTELSPSTTYFVALRAVDSSGNWSTMATTSGQTSGLPVAYLDETPLSFTAHTGQQQLTQLSVQNQSANPLNYAVRAVSIGSAKSRTYRSVPAANTAPRDADRSVRSSGKNKKGPKGESGFGHVRFLLADKAATGGELFYEDFESGTGQWTTAADAGVDLWHVTNTAYNSSSHSMAFTDPQGGTYDSGTPQDVSLVSPSIDLTNAEGDVVLEFYEWYSTELGFDYCDLDASTDGGTSWTPIRTAVSGDSEVWNLTTVDLSSFAGQIVNVRFRLHTTDELYNDYPGWYIDDVAVRDEGTSWLSFLYGVGVVGPFDSQDIHMLVNADYLCSGVYSADVHVYTNDISQTVFVVPVELAVTEATDLSYGVNSMDLGEVFIGHPESQVLTLSNIGCNVLSITDLSSTSSDFTASLSSTTIDPGGTADLVVTFSPVSPTFAGSYISLTTTDPDEPNLTVLAMGTGVHPSQIVLPDTASSHTISGEGVAVSSFEIRNDGEGELTWEFARALDPAGAPVTSQRVLIDIDVGGLHGTLPSQLSTSGYAVSHLADVNPVDQKFTQDILAYADVVILFCKRPYTSSEIDDLSNWVADGGGLFFEYQSSYEYYANALLAALGTGCSFAGENYPTESMGPLTDHALAENVNTVHGTHDKRIENLNAPLVRFLRSETGGYTQAYGPIGKGRFFLSTVLFSSDKWLGNNDNSVLVDNVVDWLADDPVTMSPGNGVLQPGTSQVTELRFDPSEIHAGTYEYEFWVVSNDPVRPVTRASATYDITGTGHLHIENQNIDLGVVYAARDTAFTIPLENWGTKPVVMQISSPLARVVPEVADMTLQPNEWRDLNVLVESGDEGAISADIQFATDVPAQGDLLVGLDVVPALPHVQVSTVDLGSVSVLTGGVDSRSFEVSNTGLWPLEYVFTGQIENHIVVTPTSGTVAAETTNSIAVTYWAGTECGVGDIAAVLALESNDQTPPEEIATSLTIVDGSHLKAQYSNDMGTYVGIPGGTSDDFQITNNGCEDLTIFGVTITGQYFSISGVQTGTLVPGASTTFSVTFAPAVVGTFSATVTIESDDPKGNFSNFPIVGEGLEFDFPGSGIEIREFAAPQNFPNPFNPLTKISFDLPNQEFVKIDVFDIRGRKMETLTAQEYGPGQHVVEWNARGVASGTYFYRLQAGKNTVTKRMTLIK